MTREVYVKLEISPSSDYISRSEMVVKEDIGKEYDRFKGSMKSFKSIHKIEVFEGFKLTYVLMNIEYDGRQRRIKESDIFRSMELKGLVINRGASMFGGYYEPTEKLNQILVTQKEKRIAMVDKGLYVAVWQQ